MLRMARIPLGLRLLEARMEYLKFQMYSMTNGILPRTLRIMCEKLRDAYFLAQRTGLRGVNERRI
jgi:hypothetical protein